MVAVMSESWDDWCKWTNISAPELLLNPSFNGKYLRINALSWIVEDKIDVSTLRKYSSNQNSSNPTSNKVDNMSAPVKCNTHAHMYDTSNETSTGDMCKGNTKNTKNTTNDDTISPNKNAHISKSEEIT